MAVRLQRRLERLDAMRDAGARLMGRDRIGRDVFLRGSPEGLRTWSVLAELLDGCEVTLLSPQTITAQAKKQGGELPATLNKYQHEAYKTACAALMKK